VPAPLSRLRVSPDAASCRAPSQPARPLPPPMGNWIDESGVKAKWEAVAKEMEAHADKEVAAAPFVEAAKSIISVFDLITGMGIAKSDMLGNATTIGNFAQGKDKITLQALCAEELASGRTLSKLELDGTTSVCALLWLTRALRFVYKMLEALMNDPNIKMKDAVWAGYEASLRPHHGMLVRGTFNVAYSAAPTRETFMGKMAPTEEIAIAKLNEVKPDFKKVLDACAAYVEKIGLKM